MGIQIVVKDKEGKVKQQYEKSREVSQVSPASTPEIKEQPKSKEHKHKK